MFTVGSKKKPKEAVVEKTSEVPKEQTKEVEQIQGQTITDVLKALTTIHEGSCVVNLYVTDNEVVVMSSTKAVDQQQAQQQ